MLVDSKRAIVLFKSMEGMVVEDEEGILIVQSLK